MQRWLPLLVTALALSSPARAQTLSLQIDPQVIEPGELTTLSLVVDVGLQDLRGYTLDLHYNRDRLNLFSIIEGDVMLAQSPTFLYWEDLGLNGNSVLHVDHAILGGDEGGEGPGALLHLVFVGVSCGLQTLWVDGALFRDLNNQPLSVAVGSGVEQQVCQVPRLYIERLPGNEARLYWDRVLNAEEYRLWWRTAWGESWLPLATTLDTSFVDPATPGPLQRIYRLTLQHD
jgi:hypothetical protein